MSIFPGAIYKPITANKGRKRLVEYNRVNLHVAVSEAPSLHGYFNKSGIPDSHFYVRRDGTVEQYVDTAYNAFADLQGNDATISIETQGGGTGEWTTAQLKSLAELFAWSVQTHGIAAKLATSSKLGDESKGLSWHRLGVDGNFPLNGILRGRLQRGGGMRYSLSRGKICPGPDKIKQIKTIYKMAKAILKPKPKKPKRVKLKLTGRLDKATITQWQIQRGTLPDGVISKGHSSLALSVQKLMNHKNGNGGFRLIKGPMDLNGKLGRRDWVAIEKLINLWDKKGKMTLRDGPLELTGKPSKRTIVALQKSLNGDLWK